MSDICLNVNFDNHKYDVLISNKNTIDIKTYLDKYEKVLIVTDKLVPYFYVEEVKRSAKCPYVYTMGAGEDYKNIDTFNDILKTLTENEFSRKDCVIGLGGGVVLDVACFASSAYMRGIDFISLPTTLLAMVDASVGGKCGINYLGYKNIVGAFYTPKHVLIFTKTLNTLDKRLISEGLAEVIKMSLTSNEDLFKYLKDTKDIDYTYVIKEALKIKIDIVTKDFLEKGIRKVLNFGHTIGHAIESYAHDNNILLYHGECVSIGMTYMVSKDVFSDLIEVLKKYNLPYEFDIDKDELLKYIKHDKKARFENEAQVFDIVRVDKIGSFKIEEKSLDMLLALLGEK